MNEHLTSSVCARALYYYPWNRIYFIVIFMTSLIFPHCLVQWPVVCLSSRRIAADGWTLDLKCLCKGPILLSLEKLWECVWTEATQLLPMQGYSTHTENRCNTTVCMTNHSAVCHSALLLCISCQGYNFCSTTTQLAECWRLWSCDFV